jgi:hypothetical protein
MSKGPLLRSIAVTSGCAVCAILALSPALAADFPAGNYKANDVSMVFDGKGNFHVVKSGTTEVSGTYSTAQGRIELTDVSGPWACAGAGQKKGTYVWAFNGTALTFTKVTDACDDRSTALLSASWQLQI